MGDDQAVLLEQAQHVLTGNRIGQSTKPAPDLYPHQWNWDSCFISIGYSRFDPVFAQQELRSLVRGQWSNGMVPQIIFKPDSVGYFPGPDVWQSRRSPLAPTEVETSGITQPPVLATAALAAFLRDPDRARAAEFARFIYPKIKAFHAFLYRERVPDEDGLVVVVHPWESGLDNSPPYLDAGARVRLTYRPAYTRLDLTHVSAANRPSNKDYDLFVWLLEQMREVDYDWSRYLLRAQLQVKDILFNAVLCRANRDLAVLAESIGEDPLPATRWAERTRVGIEAELWVPSRSLYFSFDRKARVHMLDETIASLAPLYGYRVPDDRFDKLVSAMTDGQRFSPARGFRCPTTSLSSPRFNRQNYWLGPVWVNTNWMLIQGLLDHGRPSEARSLTEQTLALVRRSGFREYFDPLSGEGYGTDHFSWSAALTIDLLSGAN